MPLEALFLAALHLTFISAQFKRVHFQIRRPISIFGLKFSSKPTLNVAINQTSN